jgi:putative spermidine/putrescine transport system substrate-binding protein
MPYPLTRRRLLAGAAGTLAAPALVRSGLIPSARAAEQVIMSAPGGDYSELLTANVEKPLLAPLGIEVLQDLSPGDARKARLAAERSARRGTMDVAFLNDFDMAISAQLNVFEPITEQNVPNLVHVLPQLRRSYSVAHAYSGKVILYNPEKLDPAPRAFADLWDPRLKGRIGFSDLLYLQIIEAAALVAGGSMSNYEPGKQKLLELKALEPKIYPSNETLAAGLKSGEVWVSIMWLARVAMWRKAGIPVTHAVPAEGATPYAAEAAVPRNARNKAGGFAYLNALLDPRAQTGFADRMGYLPTVDNAALPDALTRDIGFTAAQRAHFRTPDYAYLGANNAQLTDWWNRSFKS